MNVGDNNKFEESFSNWEYDIQQYVSDNSSTLPDQVKVAVLMSRTRGPLQQHLHPNAGASPTYAEIRATITEYPRVYTTFSTLQQNPSSAVSTNYSGGTAPKKEKARTKEIRARKATKEKVTKATANTNRHLITHKEKAKEKKLDKECLSKNNSSTKEKESHRASQQDKEKDQSYATNVANQGTQ